MRIKLTKGHHVFNERVQMYDAKGAPQEKKTLAAAGDCFDVTEKQYTKFFSYRSEVLSADKAPEAPAAPAKPETAKGKPKAPAAPADPLAGLVYDPVHLAEEYTVPELKVIAKALGIKSTHNMREATLVKRIMEKAPEPEGDDLTPSEDWSEDRLKAYLDEAGVAYAEESVEELAAMAMAHHLSQASRGA